MEENKFEYTYSAKQQDEIRRIRKKYIPQEDKLTYLKKLDNQIELTATIKSLSVGIIGSLVLGIGMSMSMVWIDTLLVEGIFVGVIGIVILSLAYPMYQKTLKKKREEIAPEIIKITDELLK